MRVTQNSPEQFKLHQISIQEYFQCERKLPDSGLS